MTFPLRILALDREIFVGEAQALTVPGMTGELQVLPQHVPFITLLKTGNITIEGENKYRKDIPIEGGVVEVNEKEVVVLVQF